MPSSNPLPTQEANLFKKALKSFEQKQCRKSLQYVKEILKKFPEHGETLSMKGLILNSYHKKAEAYECAQRGLRNDVKSHVCWHVYGLLQRADRKYDEAIKCYRNALKCDPENFQILRDLSLLQIQIRDLDGYRDTKYQLLQLRPTQRVSWIGYAMSFHLLKNYDMAISILEEFCKTQQMKTADFETSELILYLNMLYREAGLYEKAIEHLEKNKHIILDKLILEEVRGELYLKLNQSEKSIEVYEGLIERNPDNILYYRRLEECLNLKTEEEKFEFYKKYEEKFPRSDLPRKLPLEFLSGERFRVAVDKYLQRALRKGVPPLFKELKYLFNDQQKLKIVEALVLEYVQNLSTHKTFDNKSADTKEAPTCLLWTYYYLAQHYDYLNDTEKALEYINKAIDHTPTLVELYMIKGKIFKHAGNVYEAVKWLDEAQSLDTADRYINYKCSKYMLRADMINEAQEIASKFTRESTQPAEYLKEMQCMWFETESANSYKRLNKYGESLKKSHQVERHFLEMIEDQFDFHLYCMRKMTLSSYVKMLHVEDHIKSHPFFFKAAKSAIETYLKMHDKPHTDNENDKNENEENLSASELRKLKNKQKKQQLKAQQEKEKQMQLEQKKKDLNKPKKDDGNDNEVSNEEELNAERLEKCENPLEECNRFLKPLEMFAKQAFETHMLGFEVYYRKNKLLLMLRSLKKIKSVGNQAKFHYYLCKFLLKFKENKTILNEHVLTVINKELETLLNDNMEQTSVEKLNGDFLSSNSTNFEGVVEAAKVLYDLNPSENRTKALDLITNLNSNINRSSFNLDTLINLYDLIVEKEYFGKVDDKFIESTKLKFKSFYPHCTLFHGQKDQESELVNCLQSLSLAPSGQAVEQTGQSNQTSSGLDNIN